MGNEMETYKNLGLNFNYDDAKKSKGKPDAIYIQKSGDGFHKYFSFSADEAKWLVKELSALVEEMEKILSEEFIFQIGDDETIYKAKSTGEGYDVYWNYDKNKSKHAYTVEDVQKNIQGGAWEVIREIN